MAKQVNRSQPHLESKKNQNNPYVKKFELVSLFTKTWIVVNLLENMADDFIANSPIAALVKAYWTGDLRIDSSTPNLTKIPR